VVVVLSFVLFLLILGFLLLMVLMEGKATSSNSGSRCNLLLYLVPVGMLWLFLRLVLLMLQFPKIPAKIIQ